MKSTNAKTTMAGLCTSTLLAATLALTGCSAPTASTNDGDSQSADAQSAQTAQEADQQDEPGDYTNDTYPLNLMDELMAVKTLEEANQIIGSEGVKGDVEEQTGGTVNVTRTTYTWDLGDDVTIEGEFTTNDGEADSYRDAEYTIYEIDFPSKRLAEFADFSNWNEIKAQHEAGTLDYNGLVELLGGVQGIKKQVNTKGNWECYWYDEDGGYISASTGPAGKLGIALSGQFKR